MMGQQPRVESLFYYFRLEDQIPENHLLRLIDRYVDLSFVRERLKGFYSLMGRPSIDPEVLLRLLLVGYLYGITSERRLMEEVRMHLAYRWFTRLDFSQEIPDHSTFSKNRHGRFRQSGVFREVFEEIVRRCLEAGLVEGRNLAVDGTLVGANASQQSRVPRQPLAEMAQVSRTVSQYLAELEQHNPVADSEEPAPSGPVSTTDPDAAWTAAKNGPALLAYYDNYLIDAHSRVILAVEATPARFRQESVAARRMLERVEKLGLRPECLGADKAYGSGEFLAWLLARGIQPHIPVIDRRHQTRGRFTRDQFQYDPVENVFRCPQGQLLRYHSLSRQNQGYIYRTRELQCRGCPVKKRCTPAPFRKIVVHWYEPARQVARNLAQTPAYAQSMRERNKIEALFSELKLRLGLRRGRLRRLWNVAEQFYLAATAQNLKRLVKFLAPRQPPPAMCAT
ncbi:MAG TPA: IS1182 family transposase [Candidatus Acidoferrales bacterium]|nr:IS1182 family transposase [Candidatus Acidoferrales bacterium]